MHITTPNNPHQLLVLRQTDLADLHCSHQEILEIIEKAFQAFGEGRSNNPLKTIVQPTDQRSIAYSMTGRDGNTQTIGFKLAYEFDPQRERNQYQNHSLMFLCDDVTGHPLALMDVIAIDALRTAATTALLARASAAPHAHTALLVGTGLIGQRVLPFLLQALPQIERLLVYGTHAEGLRQVTRSVEPYADGRKVELVHDLPAAARQAHIVIGATGVGATHAVRHADLQAGSACVLVGYGIHADTLHHADYRIATDAQQMQLTGSDLVRQDGTLPPVDAELPAILLGQQRGRQHPAERVFAYNSGMVITDIALGRLLVDKARQHQRGIEVSLW